MHDAPALIKVGGGWKVEYPNSDMECANSDTARANLETTQVNFGDSKFADFRRARMVDWSRPCAANIYPPIKLKCC